VARGAKYDVHDLGICHQILLALLSECEKWNIFLHKLVEFECIIFTWNKRIFLQINLNQMNERS
jgi:hypothetical protein